MKTSSNDLYMNFTVKIRRSFSVIFLIIISTLLFSHSHAQNDKEAVVVEKEGKTYLRLTGKRKLMAHDPISLLKGEKYKDTVLIEVPSVKDGSIEGANIPVRKGHFNFLGQITIDGNKLIVELMINDTDDNKLRPYSWNGKYILIRKPD